jgi:two-component sensor histidine kinase
VKNNMQVISSLVSLQADQFQDPGMRDVLRDVTHRVRAMALVHEKLYQSFDLARIEFEEYIKSLLHYLWRAHGSVAASIGLTFDLKPVFLPVEIAVPCGLILNELAGNALKHAFPGSSGGEVTVELQHDAATGAVCLRVRDNGVGLPTGLDWRQSRSLGLHLVQILAGQLRGTVATGTGPGADFSVTFSLNEAQT